MRITSIESKLYRVPPTIHLQDSIQRISTWEWVITTIETDAGITGTGWTYTLGMGGSAIREIINSYLAPILIGSDPHDVERIWNRCWHELHANGSGGFTTLAIAPIDIALYDILAKKADVPLYKLLGGFRDSIPAYGSGINMHLDGDPLLEHMNEYIERGFRAVKMKIGRENPEEDVERVASVRKLIGPNIKLLLDANQKWTSGDAVRRLSMLEPYDIFWLEEPIIADDIPGHSRLRQSAKTSIALGETLFTRYQFADYIRADAVDIVQADLPRVGGFTEWMKIAKLAESHHLPVAPHFCMELSVHGLCAVPNGLILEDVQGGSLTELGLLAEPYVVRDGVAVPPERAGHGIVFDEKALAAYEVKGSVTGVVPTRV
ncbi:mandelate racemase/muconate lactonizing enzyme family protein [Ammoniphilus resinae]|uniref:L-alanine-DL-glutamate epimerase-like enolase superfamily enzyme n=1 Tax=Ammoniphilus resinae TaxID=861532 RepID=A0ABS4GQM6_9BACL|nr:mandelate racemase/muconate lactonizing enzyme family protein [Ammoniphilus resinae]MBP1932573.1 L-alanine-DL-glutamate epimerase-like enolase superfamily enzyme [Ammoniphilus resinae]